MSLLEIPIEKLTKLSELKEDYYFVIKEFNGLMVKDISYFNGIKFDSAKIKTVYVPITKDEISETIVKVLSGKL